MVSLFEKRRGTGLAPASVNRELATLRRLLYLAKADKKIQSVPKIEMLDGERQRSFVLSRQDEATYLDFAPEPLKSVAALILEAGLRISEATNLRWADVHREPIGSARFGDPQIRAGKSKNAKRSISLTVRASKMLSARLAQAVSPMVFPAVRRLDRGCPTSIIQHQHQAVREALNLDPEFVIHSLGHTMLTRLGEAGVDSFVIKRIAGHS